MVLGRIFLSSGSERAYRTGEERKPMLCPVRMRWRRQRSGSPSKRAGLRWERNRSAEGRGDFRALESVFGFGGSPEGVVQVTTRGPMKSYQDLALKRRTRHLPSLVVEA